LALVECAFSLSDSAKRIYRLSITLGVIALILGAVKPLASLLKLHVELPFFPSLLIVIGAIMLMRVVMRREPLN